MGLPVSEMLARISSRELSEWMAMDSIEPLMDRRLDILMAMLMSLIANIKRDPKMRNKPYDVAEFLPQWDRDSRTETSSAKMLSIVEMINAARGGKDLRKK